MMAVTFIFSMELMEQVEHPLFMRVSSVPYSPMEHGTDGTNSNFVPCVPSRSMRHGTAQSQYS